MLICLPRLSSGLLLSPFHKYWGIAPIDPQSAPSLSLSCGDTA